MGAMGCPAQLFGLPALLTKSIGCPNAMIDAALLDRLYARAGAAQWDVARDHLAAALEAALGRQFPDGLPRPREVEKYLQSLHLEDLALACGCAAGHDAAWDRFMAEQRPILYRAADALDPSGRAREIAD